MVKTICKHETANSERAINPELLFNFNTELVDYLDALLISSPVMHILSGNNNITHQTVGGELKPFGLTNSIADTAMFFDYSKMEADRLRKENEKLKLESELLKIDAHILSSENNNLKVEVASVKTQLNEVKYTLDRTSAEKKHIKSIAESLKSQLNTLAINAKSATPHEQVDSALNLDNANAKEIESDPERVFSTKKIDVVNDQKEELELLHVEQQDIIPFEITQEFPPNPVIFAQKQPKTDKHCSGIDPLTAIIPRENVVPDKGIEKTGHDAVKLFHKRVEVDTTTQSVKSVSKVIKKHYARKDQSLPETKQVIKATSLHPVLHDKINTWHHLDQTLVQPLHIVEPENKEEDVPVSNENTLCLDVNDINNLEPTPAPKVVIRRIVKNYEDHQKESDSDDNNIVGHCMVL